MKLIFETERLYLREFTPADAPLLFELNSDPEVTRYTLDLMKDIQQAKEALENSILPQYRLYGHGRWAVHLKENREFIGWCGLKTRLLEKGNSEIDLGYRFSQRYWGKGFATESARATIRYAFENLHYTVLVGRALPGNLASMRVLEKCGMNYTGQEVIEGLLHECYIIRRPLIP